MKKHTLQNLAWKAGNRDKYLAHKAVENAVVRGDIVAKPCERCGDGSGAHAHHDDYSKPLAVLWLCPRHHAERHRELDAIGGPVRLDLRRRPFQPRGPRPKITDAQAIEILQGRVKAAAAMARYGVSEGVVLRARRRARSILAAGAEAAE